MDLFRIERQDEVLYKLIHFNQKTQPNWQGLVILYKTLIGQPFTLASFVLLPLKLFNFKSCNTFTASST